VNLLRRIANIFDRTVDFLAILGVVLFVFIMLSVVYEIFMRYFLSRPSIWVIELTSDSLLFITFLGSAWVLRKEGHVSLDLVLNRLNPRAQNIINIITSILASIACLVIVLFSAKATWKTFQMGYKGATDLETPKWILLSVIPLGSFLLFIQFLRRAYRYYISR
jgi:TRAP-type C4-dicarboxylate transport system permease small subunit